MTCPRPQEQEEERWQTGLRTGVLRAPCWAPPGAGGQCLCSHGLEATGGCGDRWAGLTAGRGAAIVQRASPGWGPSWRTRGCREAGAGGRPGRPALSWQGGPAQGRGARPTGGCWARKRANEIRGQSQSRRHFEKGTGRSGSPGRFGATWGRCRVSQGRRVVREAWEAGAEDGSRGIPSGDERPWPAEPPPARLAELVCNRTFDKYSCWPDTPPNTTANISCPWYLPWYHKGDCRGRGTAGGGGRGRLRAWR